MTAVEVLRHLGGDDRQMKLSGHVGFDSLPDQLVNKSVNKGFDFNILCVGETGIGKSTIMDSLFKTTFESEPVSHHLPTVSVTAHTYELQESNVGLRLTIVDTVGYGDQIDKTASVKPIIDYIDQQYENYLQEELKIKRSLTLFHDTRIHACIYFISPTGHSLKSLDLVCMQQLDSKVNIIPVIAKADTVSKPELVEFKKRIVDELKKNNVKIYHFPTDDETVADMNASMNSLMPFAVVGSRDEVEIGGEMVRARVYPWGTVEVENENHGDFVKLREMLIRTNMEDLRETTHYEHYELFRKNRLQEMGFADSTADNRPVRLYDVIEKKRIEHMKEMETKEEQMRQMFVDKVKQKEAELKKAEQDLHSKFDNLRKMHAEEKRKMDDKRRMLEEEINEFNRNKAAAQAAQAQAERDLTTHTGSSPVLGRKSGKKK
ncbi:septin-11-like isoform X2 [Corticium candelabrum]|uniref:septin-11-like isoform X2 n=1 Tax=Corticium candelabrum TaxID=121492 RepID=UPI002E259079|nr:septin-11-like isoform X2 [Corticium candelabrum]